MNKFRVWLFLGAVTFFNSMMLYAQNGLPTYSIVQLTLEDRSDINILHDFGLAVDHVHWHGSQAELFLSDREIGILEQNGFEYQYLVKDTKAHADKLAEKHANKDYKSLDCGLRFFGLGEMGGYMTYEEVENRLRVLSSQNPDIFKFDTLGRSFEGNNIWSVKISDNPERNESLIEGTAYYDALTHAREPLSMMSTLYYIEWLIDNYDNPNTVAKYLVDNRQMHFILIVNPDGYIYNEQTSPNGGGGWRKNRGEIANTTCIGVDLNRNFSVNFTGLPGTHSTEPCDETYRGRTAASEVETRLVQSYIDEIQPDIAFSSHSYSDVMIDPTSNDQEPGYDFDTYATLASEFTPESFHGYGGSLYLIGYQASGTTLGFLHDRGAYAWTPEIGTQFYEPIDKICDNLIAMLEPMKFISKFAGPIPSYHSHFVPESSLVKSGETIELVVGVSNNGLRGPITEYDAILSSSHPSVEIINPNMTYNAKDVAVDFNEDQPFIIDLADIDAEEPIEFELEIYERGQFIERSSFEILPGSQKIIYIEDFENGLDNWKQEGTFQNWTVTETDTRGGKFALVDSEDFHNHTADNLIGMINPLDLSEAIKPALVYEMKHSFKNGLGTVTLTVADNNDLSNISVGNKIVKIYSGQSYWRTEVVDLSHLANYEGPLYIKMKTLVSGRALTDGVYIDNLRIIDLGLETTTSTSNPAEDQVSVNIFPNPTNSIFQVELESLGKEPVERIDIHNALGQIIATKTNPSRQEEFSLAGQPQGTYFIKIKTKLGSQLKKIVKL